MTKHDDHSFTKPTTDELDPYSWDQIADLGDEAFLALHQLVNQMLANKVKRCEALMRAAKKPRGPRKPKAE